MNIIDMIKDYEWKGNNQNHMNGMQLECEKDSLFVTKKKN